MSGLRRFRAGLETRVALQTFLLFCLCAIAPIGLFALVGYRAVSAELTSNARSRLDEVSKRYGMLINERLLQAEQLLLERGGMYLLGHAPPGGRPLGGSRVRILSAEETATGDGSMPAAAEPVVLARRLEVVRADGAASVRMHVTVRAANRLLKIVAEPVPEYLWNDDAVELPGATVCVATAAGLRLHCAGSLEPRSGRVVATAARAGAAAEPSPPEASGSLSGDELIGEWRLYLKPRYGAPEWVIQARQPSSEALAALRTFRVTGPVVTGLAMIGALLLSAVQIRRSHRPLTVLTRAAKKISRGRFNVRVRVASRDEFGRLARAFNRMSRSLADRERALLKQAYYDSLTGLPNRQLFKDRLDQELARSKRSGAPVCLLFIDLDRFKNVNDSLGHSAGDALLRLIAERLRTVIREANTLARLGGDEFTVICPEIGSRAAGALAHRILDVIRQPASIQGMQCVAQASIGIAVAPHDGATAETLVRNADTAMYRAKSTGRGKAVFFEEAMNEEAVRRLRLEQRLRQALDQGRLTLHFQPKVRSSDAALVGVEALTRWFDADEGAVSPLEFIPIAEESGLIAPLGEWAIETACKTLKHWRESGLNLSHVAVNVSMHQLRDHAFAGFIEQCLRANQLPPSCLELEITESTLAQDAEQVAQLLRRIRTAGVRIAIDDFGTGYSSMAVLQQLPVDVLKIDRAFVRDCERSAEAAALLRALIGIAHALGKQIVAEGVETPGQAAFLQAHRCQFLQGYFFGKPAPADAFRRRGRSGELQRTA